MQEPVKLEVVRRIKRWRSELKYREMSEALRRTLQFRGRSPTSVSEEAGLSLSAVNDILNSRIKNPSLDTLGRIAAVLDCSVVSLIGEGDIVFGVTTLRVPIIGTAEGGVFVMPAAAKRQKHQQFANVAVDCDLPKGKYFGVYVNGKAMDAAKPRPILPGDIAICRDFNEAAQAIENGRIYAIRRRLEDGSEETTLRRVVKFGRVYELRSESTDPKIPPVLFAHADLDGDPSKNVFILGRLYRVQQNG